MQGHVVELIRELMQTQKMSIRKISAQIASKHGGSSLGYTQQINRILNDPDYDPTFSTVEKILVALNCSLWQTTPASNLETLETRVDRLCDDVADLKTTMNTLCQTLHQLTEQLKAAPTLSSTSLIQGQARDTPFRTANSTQPKL